MVKKICENKTLFFVIFLLLALICISFYQFYKENFGYAKEYYREIKFCGENGLDPDNEICKYFPKDAEQIEIYKKTMDPKLRYQKLDALTLTFHIVEFTVFDILQLCSPLLIIIAVIGLIHKDFSSGMIQNYLMREEYKVYLKKKFKTIAKVALIIPMSLVLIFVLSCLFTKFNFNIASSTKQLAVYDSFKYNHFIIYGLFICFIQFILSFGYGCIGFMCCKQNKNSLVSIIVGYVSSLGLFLFIYLIVYALIINKRLGFTQLSNYFLISGYWYFDKNISLPIILVISLTVSGLLWLATYLLYKNKERTMFENEKQIS